MRARVSEHERVSESEAAHGRRSYGPASEVTSESKSAVEKEQEILTTKRCSKRNTAHARVSMSWCLILVAFVLATDIKCSVFVTQQLSAALLRVHEGDAKRGSPAGGGWRRRRRRRRRAPRCARGRRGGKGRGDVVVRAVRERRGASPRGPFVCVWLVFSHAG